MRPARILLVASLALAVPMPAHALPPGACVASTVGVNMCVPRVICAPGDLVTVVVVGHAAGSANCGGSKAWCMDTALCTASATADFSNALFCSLDPIGTAEAIAICIVTPGFSPT